MARTAPIAKVSAAVAALALAACGGEETAAVTETPALQASVTVGDITVAPGYVRAAAPSALTTAGYLTITSEDGDRLLGASSDVATVEVHTMEMRGGVMQMRKLDALELPAGEPVALARGGDHLMFVNPTGSLAEGATVEVTLEFEKAGEITVTLPVEQR